MTFDAARHLDTLSIARSRDSANPREPRPSVGKLISRWESQPLKPLSQRKARRGKNAEICKSRNV